MSIANKPAFPDQISDGMTYRQWLIGLTIQALAPLYLNDGAPFASTCADAAIEYADAVIDKLNKR